MSTEERCNGGNPADGGRFLESQGTTSDACWDYSWCTSDSDCLHGNGSSSAKDLSILVPQCRAGQCSHSCTTNPHGYNSTCSEDGKVTLYRAKPGSTQALLDKRSIQLDILQNGPYGCIVSLVILLLDPCLLIFIQKPMGGPLLKESMYMLLGKTFIIMEIWTCLGASQAGPGRLVYMGNDAGGYSRMGN